MLELTPLELALLSAADLAALQPGDEVAVVPPAYTGQFPRLAVVSMTMHARREIVTVLRDGSRFRDGRLPYLGRDERLVRPTDELLLATERLRQRLGGLDRRRPSAAILWPQEGACRP